MGHRTVIFSSGYIKAEKFEVLGIAKTDLKIVLATIKNSVVNTIVPIWSIQEFPNLCFKKDKHRKNVV